MSGATSSTPVRDSPFRGLGYYREQDEDWFFGRDTERGTIIANLRAARLTLLYAESGVGKSSLLRAGVAARLRELAHRDSHRGSATFVPVVFSAWKDDPVEALIGEIERGVNSFMGEARAVTLPRQQLAMAVKTASEAVNATFVIILDQFEEHFSYRLTRSDPKRLATELARCMTDRGVRANFLIAVREDVYAQLGELFAGHKIDVYGNFLHLEYLDRTAGRAAIERPIEHFNAIHQSEPPIKVEPELVDAVLDEVRRGRLVLGHGVQNGATGGARIGNAADEIEAPFLQLVMTRLWEVESSERSRTLRRATLDGLGGAETIVRTHLDDALGALAEEELASATDMFHDLVTPSGIRIAHTVGDLERMSSHSSDTVKAVLDKLDAARIVRPVEPAPGSTDERFEIFHDRLTAPLLEWVDRRDNERLRREARAQRRRANAFRALAVAAGLLLILAVLAVVFAEAQRATANRDRRIAQSIQLATSSQTMLDSDTELSTLLALQGLRISHTDQAAQALRNALSQLSERAILRVGTPLDSAAFSPDGKEIVTASQDGTARIWSASNHRQLGVLTEPRTGWSACPTCLSGSDNSINSAVFSPDGTKILTASEDGTARVWSTNTHKLVGVLTNPASYGGGPPAMIQHAAFSPDGKMIVTASDDSTARIWSASTQKLLGVLTEPGTRRGSGWVMMSAVFSPDGTKILTASADGTARIWSASTHKQVGVVVEPPAGAGQYNNLASAVFSPDGTKILTASQDGTARIWSASSYRPLSVLAEPQSSDSSITDAVFSRDGGEIITASQDGTARIWNASNYQQIRILAGQAAPVSAAAFSPNGLTVITASSDGTVKLWNARPPEWLGVLTAGSGSNNSTFINGAAFSHDGKEIVTADSNGTARIWGARSYRLLSVIAEPPSRGSSFYSAAFSPDGNEIVTTSEDGSIRIWSASTDKQLGVLTERDTRGLGSDGAVFSPDGKEIVTGSFAVARIWSTHTHRLLGVLTDPSEKGGNGGALPDIIPAFSTDGKEIVTASRDGTARIWSASSHRQLGVLTEPPSSDNSINSAVFSSDGTKILTASNDGTARIWSATTYVELVTYTLPGNPNPQAVFSPDNKSVMTFGVGPPQIWSTELAGPAQTLEHLAQSRVIGELTPRERETYLAGT
jgi:WD40 repeat protein